jgi:hypothetical protein
MEKCGHYKHWREDFQLVKDLRIEFLRYGPPYYSTHAHWTSDMRTLRSRRRKGRRG